MFYKGKHFLSRTASQGVDIWHVALPNRSLPNVFNLCPWVQKLPFAGVTYFNSAYIGTHKNILV